MQMDSTQELAALRLSLTPKTNLHVETVDYEGVEWQCAIDTSGDEPDVDGIYIKGTLIDTALLVGFGQLIVDAALEQYAHGTNENAVDAAMDQRRAA